MLPSVADRTIAAPLTGVGRSAIAVIAITGPRSLEVIQECFAPASSMQMKPDQIRYGVWGTNEGTSATESVVLTPISSEHFEIHCHGGTAAIDRILRDLRVSGVEVISPQGFASVHQPRLIVEATEVLARCSTARLVAIVMDQVRGAMQTWATNQASRLAASPDPDRTAEGIAHEAQQILAKACFTMRLDSPLRVVLVGQPNVGKSSLVNAIVGFDRSITTEIAGTTRDVLHAETMVAGIPVRLSDTAGIRESDDAIEREGVARARDEIATADVVVRVAQPSDGFFPELAIGSPPSSSSVDVWNKCDLSSAEDLTALLRQHPETACVSAKTGEGLSDLLAKIVEHVEAKLPEAGQPAILTERQRNAVAKIAKAPGAELALGALSELLGRT